MSSQLQEAQSALVGAGDRLDGTGRSVVESLERQVNEAEAILVSANDRLIETGAARWRIRSATRSRWSRAISRSRRTVHRDRQRGGTSVGRQIDRIDAAVDAGNVRFGASGDRIVTDLNRQLRCRQLLMSADQRFRQTGAEVGAASPRQIALIDTSVEMAKEGLDTTGERLVVRSVIRSAPSTRRSPQSADASSATSIATPVRSRRRLRFERADEQDRQYRHRRVRQSSRRIRAPSHRRANGSTKVA